MKGIILLFIALMPCAAATGLYYHLDLHYDHGDVTFNHLEIIPLQSKPLLVGDNRLEVLDFEDQVIESYEYEIPLHIKVDYIMEDGSLGGGPQPEREVFDFEIKVPYFEKAKEIQFYDQEDNLILAVDVRPFAKVVDEATLLQKKSSANTIITQDNTNAEQAELKEAMEFSKISLLAVVISIALLILLMIVVAIAIAKKKNKGRPEA